jgi:phosphoglycerate kinase
MRDIDSLGDLRGRTVLLRSDLNVPLDGDRITDDGRIRASVPTLRRLVGDGARVVVCAHLGRPKGQVRPELSLRPVAERLRHLLDASVEFASDTVGDDAHRVVSGLPDGGVALVENLRFDPRETSKDDAERAALADALAELVGGPQNGAYVDDAFGAVHRKHASVFDVAQKLPHAGGGLVQREVEVLSRLVGEPERPYVVVLGGSKVSDKLGVIDNLLGSVDRILVGGGMCFTFLAAQGHEVGDSLLEPEQVDACGRLLESGAIELPVDVVVAADVDADTEVTVVDAGGIPDGQKGLDIGPRTVERFAEALAGAATVFWNGPMGVFEVAPFAAGTRGVAEAIAGLGAAEPGRESSALTVVGGGDSAAAVRALGIDERRFTHISTGGGASLEFVEGKQLPGLVVLED